MPDSSSIGHELLNVPMGDMIREMATAIADGQLQLDARSLDVAEMMGGLKVIHDRDGNVAFNDSRVFFGYDLMTLPQLQAYVEVEKQINPDIAEALDNLRTSVGGSGTEPDELIRVPTRLSMLELGFTPTFYQFVDTIIEVKIAIKITRSTESTRGYSRETETETKSSKGSSIWNAILGTKKSDSNTVTTSQVDATYSSKYSYSAEGSSLLRTKLVPLPPPPILEERIRRQMEEDVERRKRLLDKELGDTP